MSDPRGTDAIVTEVHRPVLLTHQVLPHMLTNGHGHIVAVSPAMGLKGQPFGATYSGTSAAQIKLAEALRAELCGLAIGVSVIRPSIVAGGCVGVPAVRAEGDVHEQRRWGAVGDGLDRVAGGCVDDLDQLHPLAVGGNEQSAAIRALGRAVGALTELHLGGRSA